MSAAPNFLQLVHEQQDIRRVVIADYRSLVREVMLSRIAAFPADEAFSVLTDEMAGILGCDRQYAALQLHEVTSAIYAAAKGASYD